MNEEGLRVLITGGAGFIGSNLTRKIVVYNDKLNRYYSGKHPNTLDFVWSHDQAPGTLLNIRWLEPRYQLRCHSNIRGLRAFHLAADFT